MMSNSSGDSTDTAQTTINEEYKIWKKNAPFLYDIVITHALEWPTLTVEWLPDIEFQREKGVVVQRLVLGTHTSGGDKNYLQLASVILPMEMEQPDTRKASGELELGGYGTSPDCRIVITQKILHEGEVNRARVMPQNPCLIATRTVAGPVHIWDYTKHPSKPKDDVIRPDLVLEGHTREGYGLSWSRHRTGYLATCGEDQKLMLWDVTSSSKDRLTLEPLTIFQENGHTEVIEDVAWKDENLLVSVGDDRRIIYWDPRASSSSMKVINDAHLGEINCISFSPLEDNLYVTGSADRTVALWDIRKEGKVHSFEVHADDVLQVSWNQHEKGIFASGGADRRLMVWDCDRINMPQSEEDAADGPPELLFVHGGHTSKISDLCWNANDSWAICSASEDNLLQIWKMSSEIYEGGSFTSEEDEITDQDGEEESPEHAEVSETREYKSNEQEAKKENEAIKTEPASHRSDDEELEPPIKRQTLEPSSS